MIEYHFSETNLSWMIQEPITNRLSNRNRESLASPADILRRDAPLRMSAGEARESLVYD